METEGFARRLRVLRAERGWAIAEAAEHVGVSRNTLADLERSKRQPAATTLTKLAAAYGVNIAALFTDTPTRLAQKRAERRVG